MGQAGGVFGHQVVTAVCSAADLLGTAATGPVWQCSDPDIERAFEALDRAEAGLAAARSALLAQADERSLRERTGAPSTERWLADRFRWSRAEASRRLSAARAHARQPAVHAALASGAVTVEQAAVIAAGLDQVDAVPGARPSERAEAAAVLVGQAAALDPRGLQLAAVAIVESLTRLPSVDDPADEAALERERRRAEKEAQAREQNSFRLGRRAGRTRAIIDFGTLGGATAQQWARLFGAPVPGTDGFEDTRDRAERLGDAVVAMMATAAAGAGGCAPAGEAARDSTSPVEEGPERGGPVSPVALLTVTVTLAELRAGLTGAGLLDNGLLDSDSSLSAATLRQLACDAMVVPAVMNGPSEVLDLGRSRRLFSLPQRRATVLTQRACAAPGCDRPPQACQLHHDWEWDRGGPTDKDHAVLLCEFHHRMVHRQGWAVRRAANGFPEFVPPASIDPGQRPRQHVRYHLATRRLRT